MFKRFGRRVLLSELSDPTVSEAVTVGDVRTFSPTDYGSGIFGRWQLDAFGLPGYRYELDQHADSRAHFSNSQGIDRRDHWYGFGNDRVNVTASNDGYLQLYLGDRGGVWLNRFDDGKTPDDWIDGLRFLPETLRRWLKNASLQLRLRQQDQLLAHWRATHPTHTTLITLAGEIQSHLATEAIAQPHSGRPAQHFGGGFSLLDDGQNTWTTAYRYRPQNASTRRVFGMGYFETETTAFDVRSTRRVYAPNGDFPGVIAEITLQNLSDAPKVLRHYEYWDVNVFQLRTGWFQTGLPGLASIESRQAINDNFLQSVAWNADQQILRTHLSAIKPDIPTSDAPSPVDWYPADIFLADLNGTASAVYTDTVAFFGHDGKGDPSQAEAVEKRLDGTIRAEGSAGDQPFCLVQRRDLTLQPGESVQLRYAYGTLRPDESADVLNAYRQQSLPATLSCLKERLIYFSTGVDPVVQREMAWHSYALQAAAVYNAYHKTHVLTQGSAYLYLHGIDGAPRDQALFTMPLIYLRPDLARDTLTLIMSITRAGDHQMAYAFSGHGLLDDGLVHRQPSDLDLFFLLALCEYVSASGDTAFLQKQVPFYVDPSDPNVVQDSDQTVLAHARAAVDHLLHTIGTGKNGLLRVGDGDWSDGIVIENAASRLFLGVGYEQSIAKGESIPNTQMAMYVLPLVAQTLGQYDPQMTQQIEMALSGFGTALDRQWTGSWYSRAILRDALDNEVVIGKDTINLEAQPWALISGTATSAGHAQTMIERIDTLLDTPSPSGATTTHGGQVAPAIAQLLTWGYSRSRPDLAWRSLLKQLFATHATVFPDVWFGIWTGPDSLNSAADAYPGGTWASAVTPMTDYPAMNSNPHAMALLSLIRLCGIEPCGDGLVIAPHLPQPRFTLDLPLIRLEVTPEGISGEYRAIADGRCVLHISVPAEAVNIGATVADLSVETVVNPAKHVANSTECEVALTLRFQSGEKVAFRVFWQRLTPTAAR